MREHVATLVARYLPGSLRPGAGGNASTKCPFHKGGQEKTPSFSINLDLGLFHCFTCHVSGTLRYLLRLLGLPRHLIDQELKAIQPQLEENQRRVEFEKQHFFEGEDPFKAKKTLPEALLGVYDWCPTQLLEAGFKMELLQDMEVGYDRLKQRVTYPLRDMYGSLAGIVGGRTLPHQEPKYKVYEGGYREEKSRKWVDGDFGTWFDEQFPGFKCENHDLIWNYDRVYPRVLQATSEEESRVFVVEGFKACLWMIQCGYLNTIALMGSYVSNTQQRLLHRLAGPVYLFFDNDDAGRRATRKVGEFLWRPLHGRLKVVQYPEEDVQLSLSGQSDTQPDDYEAQGVHKFVNDSLDFHVYMSQR